MAMDIRLFRTSARVAYHAEGKLPERIESPYREIGWRVEDRTLRFALVNHDLVMYSSDDPFPTWRPTRDVVTEKILWLIHGNGN